MEIVIGLGIVFLILVIIFSPKRNEDYDKYDF